MDCDLSWSNLGTVAPRTAAERLDAIISEFKERGLTTFAIAVAVVPCLHMLFHGIIKRLDNSLPEVHRISASHHAVELLFGTVGTPIAFAATRRLMFCIPQEVYDATLVDAQLGCSLAVCAMYASELSGRLSSTRPLTTLHHVLTMLFFTSILIETNELMIVTGSLFVTGALVEAPLFAGLLLYRFRMGRERLAWWVLLVGLLVYAVTRVLQLSLHVALCLAFDLSKFPPFSLFWVLGAGFALEVIQAYTFIIYRKILRKVMPRHGRDVSSGGVGDGHGCASASMPAGMELPQAARQSSELSCLSTLSSVPSCLSLRSPSSPKSSPSPLALVRKLQRWDVLPSQPSQVFPSLEEVVDADEKNAPSTASAQLGVRWPGAGKPAEGSSPDTVTCASPQQHT